ncbi:MAG: cation:proton antiporter [SAR324 cluster bacterium]|nr:cation:proton antiporter [SAR324 cluster bacterium]MBL7034812.1 cation:proton antiporter [SAR324 cluster bacterium]
MKLNLRNGVFTLILSLLSLPAYAGGGGGGSSLIEPLGAMLLAAAVVAIILSYAKQASLFAFIIIGVIFGGVFNFREIINGDVMTAFVDIGITLLLFMAGMEVDIPGLIKRWKLLLINGFGQIIGLFVISIGLGAAYVGIDASYMEAVGLPAANSTAALIYFALCLTLSSTILVIGTLKSTGQIAQEHGQVALGLMVLQDIVAVVALAILGSLNPDKVGGASLGVEVGLIFAKMFGLAIVLYFVTKHLLNPLFKFFAQSEELLFIGTLGYGMGVAALCEVIHFSSGIGAFFAGATLAALPYRHEIEDKVEPLKAFGVILFFMGLGFDISEFKLEQMLGGLTEGFILAVLVVILTIPLMLILGFLSRLNAKPAFLMGAIINQSSEFSLMLAVLCLQYKIFDPHIFIVVTLVVLISFFFSALGHQFLDQLYGALAKVLSFMDGRSTAAAESGEEEFAMEGHVVIMEYNELAIEIADFYAERGQNVLLLDLDPRIIDYFEKQHGHSNIHAHYSNMADPDVWEDLAFDKAKIVISCMDGGQEAELAITRWLKITAPDVPFLAATSSHEETLELYAAGARYVIQTEYLAAKAFRNIFEAEETKPPKEAFREVGESHLSETQKLQVGLGEAFANA